MEWEADKYHSDIARGTFWSLVGSGIIKLFSFFNIIYIARMASQGDVGLFYLAISIVGLLGAWKTFGLPAALVRYVPYFESMGQGRKANDLLKYTFAINVAAGILLSIALWLAADAIGMIYGDSGVPGALRLISSYVFLDNMFATATSYLQSRSDMRATAAVNNAQAIARFVLTVAFFMTFGPTLFSLTMSFMLSYVFSLAVSAWLIAKKTHPIPSTGSALASSEVMNKIVPFGITLTLIQIVWTLISFADRAILGYMTPQADSNAMVAIYSLAVTLAMNIMVFPGTVGSIFLPEISKLAGKSDFAKIRKIMATAQRWVLFITMPFSVVMIAFAREMLTSFYGTSYGSGWMVMTLFSIGMLFASFVLVISLALAGIRKVGLELKIVFATFLVNIVLCIALIPKFGMEGAAAASAVSFAVYAALLAYYGHKILKFSIPAQAYKLFAAGMMTCALIFVSKPAFASAASALPVFAIQGLQTYISKIEYLLLLGVVSTFAFIVFGALALVAKCFGKEDVQIMRKASKKAGLPQGIVSLAEKIMLHGIAEVKQ